MTVYRPIAFTLTLSLATGAAAANSPACRAWDTATDAAQPEVREVSELVARLPAQHGFSLVMPQAGGSPSTRVYRVPLVGAERDDTVTERTEGPLECRRYEWQFHGIADRTAAGPDLTEFENEGKLCVVSGRSLAFVRHTGEPAALLLFMDQRPLDAALDDPPYEGTYILLRMRTDGGADELCRLPIPPR